MARYIDMDKLLQDMCASHHLRIFSRNDADDMFEKMVGITQRQPTADVVEVVRCKDCKWFEPYEGEEHKGDCAELVGLESCVYEDDFCSYGERRKSNAE